MPRYCSAFALNVFVNTVVSLCRFIHKMRATRMEKRTQACLDVVKYLLMTSIAANRGALNISMLFKFVPAANRVVC